MKKFGFYIMLAVMMCMAAGCGKEEEEDNAKSVDQIIIDQKFKAEDAVDALNDRSKKIESEAGEIEEE